MGQSLIQYMTFLGGLGYIGVLGDVIAKSEEQKRVSNNNINFFAAKLHPSHHNEMQNTPKMVNSPNLTTIFSAIRRKYLKQEE